MISAIKLNNEEICSDAETSPDEDTSCAKFEMIGNGTGGRWDGVLTIYTQSRRKSIQVDINLDSAAWALGVISRFTFFINMFFIKFSLPRTTWVRQKLSIKNTFRLTAKILFNLE